MLRGARTSALKDGGEGGVREVREDGAGHEGHCPGGGEGGGSLAADAGLKLQQNLQQRAASASTIPNVKTVRVGGEGGSSGRPRHVTLTQRVYAKNYVHVKFYLSGRLTSPLNAHA